MKLNGSHKFKATSDQVFKAILNPEILKESIPNCHAIEYLDPNRIQATISIPLPGLKGSYTIVLHITERRDPSHLQLTLQRQGRAGSVNAVSNINLVDEPDGALLSYDTNAELEGAAALANNPIGQGAFKSGLGSFFKNLEKHVA